MTSQGGEAIAHPVRMQLEAYNRKDIDDFLRWWAPDCVVYAFPDTVLASGVEELRARHVERFKEPHLFGRLLSRIVVGDLVVDHESVERSFPQGRGSVEVVAIYEVRGGQIAKAWFKMGAPVLDAPG